MSDRCGCDCPNTCNACSRADHDLGRYEAGAGLAALHCTAKPTKSKVRFAIPKASTDNNNEQQLAPSIVISHCSSDSSSDGNTTHAQRSPNSLTIPSKHRTRYYKANGKRTRAFTSNARNHDYAPTSREERKRMMYVRVLIVIFLLFIVYEISLYAYTKTK